MTHANEPRPSLFALARRLASGVVQLVRLEVTHGRQEIGEMLAETRTGVVLFGIAAAIALLALVSLDVVLVLGVVALLGALPAVAGTIAVVAAFVAVLALYGAFGVLGSLGRAGAAVIVVVLIVLLGAAFAVPTYLGFYAAWHSALFVLVLQVAIVPLFIVRGIRHIRIGPPEQTIASVKEDIAWAKRLLRRG
jgi:uncharacterized membrane protein YqjE